MVGAFDGTAADDGDVAIFGVMEDGRGTFDVQFGRGGPEKFAGVGVETEEGAVAVFVESLADDEGTCRRR